jgi:hypothetical protein
MSSKLILVFLPFSTFAYGQTNKLYKYQEKTRRYGFIDKTGKIAFNRTWKDGYGGFQNGIAYVSNIEFADFYPIDGKVNRIQNSLYSRIDVGKKLNTTSSSRFDTLFRIKQDSLWGFKDINGEIVIKPKYYLADKFENGLCAVRLHFQPFEALNDVFFDAIINTKGQVVSEQPMHCYLGFQGDLIVYYGGFHFSGGVHYLDKKGQRVIPRK